MIITFSVGSKCAVMLPRKFANPQITPAKGLIINRLVDSSVLVLIEEVWQFKGLSNAPLKDMCVSTGTIRSNRWGWLEVPVLVKNDDYLILPASQSNLMEPSIKVIEELIKKSVLDFKELNGFI